MLSMDSMSISEFKAKCLAALERVRRTGRPLRVTRFGKPVADIVPPTPEKKATSWLGCMKGKGKILGDIISPIEGETEWHALKE